MAHLATLAGKRRYAPSYKRQYWPASTHTTTSQTRSSHHTARHADSSFDMIQAVLDKSTGQLMEMWHLFINPKYKELWGKLYTEELQRHVVVDPILPPPCPPCLHACHTAILLHPHPPSPRCHPLRTTSTAASRGRIHPQHGKYGDGNKHGTMACHGMQ